MLNQNASGLPTACISLSTLLFLASVSACDILSIVPSLALLTLSIQFMVRLMMVISYLCRNLNQPHFRTANRLSKTNFSLFSVKAIASVGKGIYIVFLKRLFKSFNSRVNDYFDIALMGIEVPNDARGNYCKTLHKPDKQKKCIWS
jgi:hypothetical protein